MNFVKGMKKKMIKVAIAGSDNASRAAAMLRKYAPPDMTITHIETLKPFTHDYDLIINFSTRPGRIAVLLTCTGVKVARVCGSDWHRSILGKELHRAMLWLSGLNIMYASEALKNDVWLKGEVHVNPVNENHFYPRGMPRDKEVCYYVNRGRLTYQPELMPDGATLIDGTVPYEDMPDLLSSHKRYIRHTTHDASPKLPYEALLCGCEVWVNGEKLLIVPEYMLTSYQGPRWIKYILGHCVK